MRRCNSLVFFMLLAVFCISVLGSVSAANVGNNTTNATNTTGLADSACPESGINSNHTDQSNYTGPQTNTTKWTYNNVTVYGSAVIGSDGTIYVGGHDGVLYVFSSDGTLKWTWTTRSYILGSPAIGSDGTIYISNWMNSTIYAISSNGTLKWKYTMGDYNFGSSPVIGADGTIYIPSTNSINGTLYAFYPDGTLKWTYHMGMIHASSAAIGAGGTIYIADYNGVLYAINPNGTLKWSYTLKFKDSMHSICNVNVCYDTPSIGSDGTIYIGSYGGSCGCLLFAISDMGSEGTVKWSYPYQYQDGIESLYGAPAISSNGTIYVVGASKIYAISSDGTLLWTYSTGGISDGTTSVVIGLDGTVYFGSSTGMYALTPEGKLKWSYATGSIQGSPVIGSDGTLYIGTTNGVFYAFNDIAADFTANTNSSSTVQFTDKSTNSSKSWLWNFGDGTTSTEQNPTHNYSKAGNYAVVLTVTLQNGGTVTRTKTVTIKEEDITAPTVNGPVGGVFNTTQTVTLTGSDNSGSATIYYTTDGSDPRTSTTRIQYTNPIMITSTTTLNYAAVDPSGNWSPLCSEKYTIIHVVYVQDASYYSNGSLNDQIQSILDNAASGSTIVFLGTHYENLHLVINKELNLVANGTSISSNSLSAIFSINGSQASGTAISGFTLINTGTGSGILVDNASNVTISNDKIRSTGGSAISVNRSSNITMDHDSLTNSVTGVNVSGSDHITVTNSQINNNGNGVILQGASNVNINNNTINSNGDGVLLSGSVIDITIKRNTMDGNSNGIDMEYNHGENVTIQSNIITNCYDGVTFGRSYAVGKNESIKHNFIYGNTHREVDAIDANYLDLSIPVGSNVYGVEWSGNDPFFEPGSLPFCCKIKTQAALLQLIRIGSNTYAAYFVDGDTGDIMADLPSVSVTFTGGGSIMMVNGVAIATVAPSKIINQVSASVVGMTTSTPFDTTMVKNKFHGKWDNSDYGGSNNEGYNGGTSDNPGNGKGNQGTGTGTGSGNNQGAASSSGASGSSGNTGASASGSSASSASASGISSILGLAAATAVARELFINGTKNPQVLGIIGIVVLIILVLVAYYRKDLKSMIEKSKK
jgi:parallel beta-helix repeat protein